VRQIPGLSVVGPSSSRTRTYIHAAKTRDYETTLVVGPSSSRTRTYIHAAKTREYETTLVVSH